MKYNQVWQGRIIDKKGYGEWFKASVPGNIQYDYGVAHEFGDADYMDNFMKYKPLEDATWEYQTVLKYTAEKNERVFFVSNGIDYIFDILLNGEVIYSYEGMYKKVELDITDKTKGSDTLSVIIHPHPKRKDAPENTRCEADNCCKPPVSYGWDWNPRLLSSGMWQDAYIETRGNDYLNKCEPFCSVNDDFSKGTVDFEIDCDGEFEITVFNADNKIVYAGKDTHFELASPNLWWCNGQGEPYLYQWNVKSATDEKSGTLAFKRVRIVRNEGAADPPLFPKSRYDAPATIELNGRKILVKGSNWVNPELFFGRANEKRYEELLTAVKDANMNMLRIWGGSGVNKESFYSICDRFGIMVWQEFMLACNRYPDTKEYLTVLENEAISIIKMLRSHACLTLWCGGNELFNSWSGMDDQSLPLRLLDRLCYKYDFGRPFIKTSPLTGMAHGCYNFSHPKMNGDIFHSVYSSRNTAYIEFGIPSMTDIETIRKIIPESELFPVKPTKAWIDRHGLKAWGENSWICQDVLENYYGKAESLEELIDESERLQCIGYQAAFEGMRQQWPHCGMIMNWCLNEPWSNAANNCIISYPARLKKSYYSVKKALRPTMFSAGITKYDWKQGEKFSADIWLLNDAPKNVSSTVTVEIVMADKTVTLIEWKANAEAGKNTQGPTVHFTLPESQSDFFFLRLKSDDGMDNEYQLLYRHNRDVKKVSTMNL